jgi:HlyD family secretion protein
MKKKYLIIIGVVLIIAVTLGLLLKSGKAQIFYRFAKIEKGDITQTINATGIVQPVEVVQVGTQVTGVVMKLFADFNSKVTKGEVIAQIDPAIYETAVAQSNANLLRSQSEVERVKANLMLAEKELLRAQELEKRDLISKSELDTAQSNRDSLIAQIKSAEASVEQSRSALKTSQVNLDYTTISSPIDGVVISRNVDEGQTVVANYSAQVIYNIAQDLKKVKVEATIPEADIGKISVGQPVTFTVDAYQDMEFSGSVIQVRLSPTTVQNVVTYTVIIHADNEKEKLLPGMTANMTFEVAHRQKVLKVPNAALRFTPESELIDTDSTAQDGEKEIGQRPVMPMGGQNNQKRPAFRKNNNAKKVWLMTDKSKFKGIRVIVGITDGSFTEILRGDIKENQEIVAGTIDKDSQDAKVNPFGPQMGRRR